MPGYYGNIHIEGDMSGKVEYIHHVHSLTSNSETVMNDSAAPTSVSSSYADSFAPTTSGGCFTSGRYTSHSHNSSCYHYHSSSCPQHTHSSSCKHKHDSSCGKKTVPTTSTCRGTISWKLTANGTWEYKCNRCSYVKLNAGDSGISESPAGYDGGKTEKCDRTISGTTTTYSCGYGTNNPYDCGKTEGYTCGYSDGEKICGDYPNNTEYRYFRSCNKTAGQVVEARIHYEG